MCERGDDLFILAHHYLHRFSRELHPKGENPGISAFIRERLAKDAHDLYETAHRELDRLLLTNVLEHTRGNQRQAARFLGIARQTLRQKLRDLGLQVTHAIEEEADEPV